MEKKRRVETQVRFNLGSKRKEYKLVMNPEYYREPFYTQKDKVLGVMKGLSKGLSDKEIGRDLKLPLSSIKYYVKILRWSLGVTNRVHILARAIEIDLVRVVPNKKED